MLIKNFIVGQLQTNCYIVTDEKTLACAIIDPGAESAEFLTI
jgi:glyoxylase-like metal-dependent hydrolase (beta-lactamase superfamily II)